MSFFSPSQPEEKIEVEEDEPEDLLVELEPFAELFFDKPIFEEVPPRGNPSNNNTPPPSDSNDGGSGDAGSGNDPEDGYDGGSGDGSPGSGTDPEDSYDEGSGDYPDGEDEPVVPVPIVKEYQRNGKFSLTRRAPQGGKLQVQIEVDGPLADYMEVVNPQSATPGNGIYTFEDGEEFVLDWQLKPRDKIGGLPPLSELSEDQLFGSKVMITAYETLVNGSTKTVKQDAYLYRWLEVVGATDPELSTGKTAAFHEKLNRGLGKFVKEKKVGLHLPVSVATTFKGEKAEFKLGGENRGIEIAKWLYEGDLSQKTQGSFSIKAGDFDIGKLIASTVQIVPGVYVGYRAFPTLSKWASGLEWLADLTLGQAKHLTIVLVINDAQLNELKAHDETAYRILQSGYKHGIYTYALLSGWPGEKRSQCAADINPGSPLPLISIPFPFPNLTVFINADADKITKLEGIARVNIPNGSTNTQFISRLINAANQYSRSPNALYFPVPSRVVNRRTYNSNSFVTGVIQEAGGLTPALSILDPGAESPLPIPFEAAGYCELGLEIPARQ